MLKLGPILLFLAAHAAFADAWTPRAAAFREKQAAERKRLGLDGAKAAKAYPTPEVFFGASWACPGETSTVLLEGKLLPGTLVGTGSQSVEIVKEELTPRGWQASVKVKPGTKDGVTLQVIAPVSGITGTIELPIGCPKRWVLDFKTGDRLQLQVVDDESRAAGEWFHGTKSAGTRTFSFSTDGKILNANQEDNAEDHDRVAKAQAPMNDKGTQARQQELTLKMQGCANLAPSAMSPCIQQYSGELQALMAVQQSAAQNIQAAMTPTVGCKSLTGTIEGKKLKGEGSTCAGSKPYEPVQFTGVIR